MKQTIPDPGAERILVVFFSRTGRTQACMARLMELLSGERLVTIRAHKKYTGPIGSVRAIFEVFRKKPAAIEPVPDLPAMGEYDLVVLGTPVWAGQMSSPLRAFLTQYGRGVRRAAYVATHSGPEAYGALFDELDGLLGVKRAAALSLARETPEALEKKLSDFAEELRTPAR